MRVLITGSTGFVGSNIIDYFINHTDVEVVGVYRHTPPRSCDAEYVQCDLLDREDIRKKLSEKQFDAVISLAGQMRGEKSGLFLHNTVEATENIIHFCEENSIPKLIYASSIAVYGYVTGEVNESSDHVSTTDYGLAKDFCERLVEDSEIPQKIVLRLPRVLGRNIDYSYPWLPKLAWTLMQNQDVNYKNPDLPYNNLLHVNDLSVFIKRLLTEPLPYEGYHLIGLGSPEPLKILEIVSLLKLELGSSSVLHDATDGKGRNTVYAIDLSRAIHDYGFIGGTVRDTLVRFAEDCKV